MFVNTIFCMIPHHFKQETTTYRKNRSRHQAHRWWRGWSVLAIVIPEKYIFFIWKKTWMTRIISAESWKADVFELITTYTFSLSPWAFLEYFTQGNSLVISGLYPRKSIPLSYWVVGHPLKYIYTMFLILIRGYSITQGKPFYNIYIYILDT